MKYVFFYMSLLAACMAEAQIHLPQLSAGNHATLDSVTASYRLVPNAQASAGELYVKASLAIRLKSNQNPARVFVKLLDPGSQAQLYAADYAPAAAPVLSQGDTLLRADGNGHLLISCPPLLPLKRYTWKVYTQNAQGQSSNVFTTEQ